MTTSKEERLERDKEQREALNNFSINVATTNGTGSQTANIALARALFRMGLTVSPKNLFPSNIQGLPTWFRLRVSDKGYYGYRDKYEILIAMNQVTIADDHRGLASGGVMFYDDSLRLPATRDDVIYYPIPVRELTKQMELPTKLKAYIANMAYVGVVSQLLGIELDAIEQALFSHFKGKEKAVALNMKMVNMAAQWAAENLEKSDPYKIEAIEGGNEDWILVNGNTAAGLGAIYGGVTVVVWYPITPSTSIIDTMNAYLPKLRKDPETQKATYAVVQAEDELAAIGGIIGAGWAGARACTATSGPGLSLMAEFAGLAYFAEIPSVVWDVQRVGPSTGLPTRTSQGDLMAAHFLSHGDGRHPVLLPATPDECFEFGYKALDLAEELQTLIFVLSDLDLGMNNWMSKPFQYPETPIKRGKVLSKERLEELGKSWGRFLDIDGDGIPYRTLPGTDHPLAGFFTRGTGHNEMAAYSEKPTDWEKNLERLYRKFETARELLPPPEIHSKGSSRYAIISFGSNHPSIIEALDIFEANGTPIDYLRLRALPINEAVREFTARYENIFIIENNYEGQLHNILQLEMPEHTAKMISITRCNGLPFSPEWIVEQLEEQIQKIEGSQN